MKNQKSLFLVIMCLLIISLVGCNDDDDVSLEIIAAADLEDQLDAMDEGGRWLVTAIEEVTVMSISDEEKATLTNYFYDLGLDMTLRCDDANHDDFLESVASYPDEALKLVEDTQLRLCSDLNFHEGYWVIEVVDETSGSVAVNVSDIHIDAATTSITVYAQTTLNGIPYQPAQVGPGEDPVTTLTGEMATYHPNAVYLNGSGEEYLEDVGGGSWWVKHSWLADGGSYLNWSASQFAIDYGPGTLAESILLEDGYTIKVGDLDESESGGGNTRQPILTTEPVSYEVLTFRNFGDTEPVRELILECTEGVSPLDGLTRSCPSSKN